MNSNTEIRQISAAKILRVTEKQWRCFAPRPDAETRYEKIHANGAKNTCVYEVTFLDQVKSICDRKEKMIFICGTDAETYDATTADGNLQKEGYSNISILEGGLAVWQQAGCPLAEETTDQDHQPEKQFADGRFHIDLEESVIQWAGRNPNNTHWGTIRLSSGKVTVNSGEETNEFSKGMTCIAKK